MENLIIEKFNLEDENQCIYYSVTGTDEYFLAFGENPSNAQGVACKNLRVLIFQYPIFPDFRSVVLFRLWVKPETRIRAP